MVFSQAGKGQEPLQGQTTLRATMIFWSIAMSHPHGDIAQKTSCVNPSTARRIGL